MRKEGFKNLKLTRYSEGNRSRGKQQVTELINLCKWIAEKRLEDIVRGTNMAYNYK